MAAKLDAMSEELAVLKAELERVLPRCRYLIPKRGIVKAGISSGFHEDRSPKPSGGVAYD
ncbi:MAG: hypothetical protein ACXV44_07990 [Halobacteriota archaeon]